MGEKQAGKYSKDITKQQNNRWTFVDRSIRLKKNDVLYFWAYVLESTNNVSKVGHETTLKEFVVQDFIYDDPATTTSTTKKTPTTKTTTIRTTTLKPGCLPTSTKINDKKSTCAGKLIFQDNFGALVPEKWQTEVRFAGIPVRSSNMFIIINYYKLI